MSEEPGSERRQPQVQRRKPTDWNRGQNGTGADVPRCDPSFSLFTSSSQNVHNTVGDVVAVALPAGIYPCCGQIHSRDANHKTIFRATDHMLRDTVLYPSLFRTAEDDEIQFAAISDLLVHFGWTWVGIIASDNDNGEKESHELIKQLTRRKICIEFVLVVKEEGAMNENLFYGENIKILQASTSRVAIICGSVSVFFFIALEEGRQNLYNKTLIFTSSWIFNLDLEASPIITFNGSLAFTIPSRRIPGMQNFLESVHPSSRPTDFLLEDIWLQFFRCFTSNQPKNEMYEAIYKSSLRNCTGEERIVDISDVVYDTNNFRTSYQVYSAVYTMAHALHNIYTSGSANSLSKYKQQLKRYMRKVHFKDPAGEEIYFNEKGMIPTKYHIINRVVFANGSFLVRQVGSFSMMEPEGQQLLINDRDIIWKESNNEICRDVTGEDVEKKGSEVRSRKLYSDVCRQCPDNQWPNERSNACLPKTLEFLSYETDVIASVFSFFSILFSFLTAIVLGIFVSFRDTPIVKANNQNVSFVLLVSLIVSFLCVFLFLGRPVHTTCILRQTCFGIIFSIAVSSVLAKTIMVYIAFKATKPNNVWKKYLGVKMSNIIVTTCSFIQVVICVSWLAFSPPFQELNMTSHPGKIIIKCNEGSSVAFYCVLGYIGCLATLSFFVAFLVRALPDNFNEGKYITFSMLLFCCVWICVIPVYLSTEGKNMVAVEVFAILISTAGLLSCIFFPKCYIILWRPEQNTKQHLMGKISK
ncbi:vomeronasal type-2 receptor 116-like [Rhinophrynus dorsalis]